MGSTQGDACYVHERVEHLRVLSSSPVWNLFPWKLSEDPPVCCTRVPSSTLHSSLETAQSRAHIPMPLDGWTGKQKVVSAHGEGLLSLQEGANLAPATAWVDPEDAGPGK